MNNDPESNRIAEAFDLLLDEDEAFFYFIDDEFRSVVGQSSAEELARYAFGSLEETIEAYAKFKQRNS